MAASLPSSAAARGTAGAVGWLSASAWYSWLVPSSNQTLQVGAAAAAPSASQLPDARLQEMFEITKAASEALANAPLDDEVAEVRMQLCFLSLEDSLKNMYLNHNELT